MASGTDPRPRLFQATDPASVAAFRFWFGVVLSGEALRFLLSGKLREDYLDTSYQFKYYGFGWVQTLPEPWLQGVFVLLGACGLLVAVGLWYRAASGLLFLCFAYIFLIEKARYLNHYYLVILLAFLLAVLPVDRGWSLDARRRGEQRALPRWVLELLRAQIGLVYFFAGIAKLNADWLRARPLLDWLPERSNHPVLGRLLEQDWNAWAFSYGGLALDLFCWPLLAWRRTRALTFVFVLSFHLLNASIFGIGMFPWMMIGATTIFFEPGWPRRLLRRPLPELTYELPKLAARSGARAFFVLYLAIQFALPLRHWLYPGNVNWTEEGHRFSWHMKLRDKEASVTFRVTDLAAGQTSFADPYVDLKSWQLRKMSGRPDMIHQYALHLAERERSSPDGPPLQVRVTCYCSLNGRPRQLLIDPAVDLAAQPRGYARAAWILPLKTPLLDDL